MLESDQVPLANQCFNLGEEITSVRTVVENHLREEDGRYEELLGSIRGLTNEFKSYVERAEGQVNKMAEEIAILRRAVAGSSLGATDGHFKPKIPEPKAYGGSRCAKELENFLWDMEQYFKAAHIKMEDQVTITSMYLVEDAKLWWRTRMEDVGAGRATIATWEALKQELKDQFLPLNVAWIARESLKALKQKGSIRDYVKEFSSVVLDIKNMSEEDKLFNFMSGLKPWAQNELRRQAVKDLASAIAAADGLVDYKFTSSSDGAELGLQIEGDPGAGKDKKKKGKKKMWADDEEPKEGQQPRKSSKGCYICGGAHFMRECPKKEKLNAILVEEPEEQPVVARAGSLRLVNALQVVENAPEGGAASEV